MKLLKVGVYLDILEFCISSKVALFQSVLQNFPLHREEYQLHVDSLDKNYVVAMRPLEILKEFKFNIAFKGYNEASMSTLNSLIAKLLTVEKRSSNFIIEDQQDLIPTISDRLQSCMRRYFALIEFTGQQRHFNSQKYPKMVRYTNKLKS